MVKQEAHNFKSLSSILKTSIKVGEMSRLRIEFKTLIERCGCFQASIGECHPKLCYPCLYKLAYPNNGCNVKSHLVHTGSIGKKLILERSSIG